MNPEKFQRQIWSPWSTLPASLSTHRNHTSHSITCTSCRLARTAALRRPKGHMCRLLCYGWYYIKRKVLSSRTTWRHPADREDRPEWLECTLGGPKEVVPEFSGIIPEYSGTGTLGDMGRKEYSILWCWYYSPNAYCSTHNSYGLYIRYKIYLPTSFYLHPPPDFFFSGPPLTANIYRNSL